MAFVWLLCIAIFDDGKLYHSWLAKSPNKLPHRCNFESHICPPQGHFESCILKRLNIDAEMTIHMIPNISGSYTIKEQMGDRLIFITELAVQRFKDISFDQVVVVIILL